MNQPGKTPAEVAALAATVTPERIWQVTRTLQDESRGRLRAVPMDDVVRRLLEEGDSSVDDWAAYGAVHAAAIAAAQQHPALEYIPPT